ncbi:MAG: hypothetical protein V4669_13660 [Pseudomonadota bacterium]
MDELHSEKHFWSVFFDRFDALMNDAQLMRVYRKFGREVFRRSAALEGLNEFVKANGFKGGRCVEIGTCHGITALILARYFDEVVSIDIAPFPLKHEIAAFLKVKNITFIDVKDNAEKAQVIKALDFDAAFCDGDHAADTETDFALVARCGHVLFHEHWAPQPPVLKLVETLKRKGRVATAGKWAIWDGREQA